MIHRLSKMTFLMKSKYNFNHFTSRNDDVDDEKLFNFKEMFNHNHPQPTNESQIQNKTFSIENK